MKHVITLLAVLTISGCQTAKNNPPFVIQTSKEIVSILVHKESDSYSVQVQRADYKLDKNNVVITESKDILSAPKVTGSPNQWLHCDVNERPKTLDSKISYLIDGEMLSVPAFPGVNLISKTTPINNKEVRVRGIFVASKFDKNRKLAHMSLPIDVVCTLGKETVLYEKEIKFEPARGPCAE